ncbi:hypothetical protein [Desulfomonile tiedjei]|uniref:Uncharacterized protein n=1 Tax=Desulfomonile tiedjei (strain ATCC 49306 / DSM 6799 / DCB-1) TaxID=706587 RepID=I4CA17_DESTA|nr:hypothetical protein [Desulfomonile tiedjei]AFM26408.1 hypothetical protein Desti_3764 [Desulfomonile tiedjei DSM 6799]
MKPRVSARECKHMYGGAASIILAVILLGFVSAWGQVPFPPQQPMGPPGPPVQQPPQGMQQPTEYAFRPDLTNPQFGECLNLEKQWKMLYQHYVQEYQRAQMMNPRDPNYGMVTRQMQNLKYQLDNAWNTFSSRCVYFPRQR